MRIYTYIVTILDDIVSFVFQANKSILKISNEIVFISKKKVNVIVKACILMSIYYLKHCGRRFMKQTNIFKE